MKQSWMVKRGWMAVMLACGVLATGMRGQQLVPHDWPDTVMSMGCGNVGHLYRFMDASGNASDFAPTMCGSISAAPLTASGTITYGQPGYDPTTATNGSMRLAPRAELTGANTAANDLSFKRAGGFEVITPVLGLNSGTNGHQYAILTKSVDPVGLVYPSNTGTNGYGLMWEYTTAGIELQLNLSGSLSSIAGGGGVVGTQFTCFADTAGQSGYYFPAAQTYDIVVHWPGDGNPSNVVVSVNGVPVACSLNSGATGAFSGILKATVTAGGTGYSSSFAVTFTGGGCETEPSGWTATASGGVIASIANTTNTLASWGTGCTSAPTPVLTAGGGSGGTATSTLNPADISSGPSTANPAELILGDAFSDWPTGSTNNFAGFASYPNGISQAEATQHFAALDWYRAVLPAKPASPVPVVVNNDFCADMDGPPQLWLLENLQQMGYVNVLMVIDSEGDTYGPQWAQNALSRAGMAGIPVTQETNTDGSAGFCSPTVTAVTSAPFDTRTNYPAPTSQLRQLLAAQANGSVVFFDGAAPTWLAALLTSSADGYSPDNGVQLVTAKVAALYQQDGYLSGGAGSGGNWGLDKTSAGTLLSTWPSTVPMYANGLSPVANGPGSCYVYPTTSVPYLTWYYYPAGDPGNCAAGTDQRSQWDTYATVFAWMFPTCFTQSASGLFTYNPTTGAYSFNSGTPSGQYSTTAESCNSFSMQSFQDSVLWTDPDRHSPR